LSASTHDVFVKKVNRLMLKSGLSSSMGRQKEASFKNRHKREVRCRADHPRSVFAERMEKGRLEKKTELNVSL